MKGIKIASWVALGVTALPCLLYFANIVSLDWVKVISLIGSLAWFGTTPFWMGRIQSVDAQEVEI